MNNRIYLAVILVLCFGCAKQDTTLKTEQAVLTTEDFIKRAKDYLANGDTERAIRTFQDAAIHSPHDFNIPFMLGQVFFHNKQYKEAIESFNNAIRLNANDGHAYLLAGGSYDLLGNREKAIEYLKKSVAIFQKERDADNFKRAATALSVLTKQEDNKESKNQASSP